MRRPHIVNDIASTLIDDESMQKLISHRIDRAHSALKEAEFCDSGRMYNLAINRLYFSCYHITSALLLDNHLNCKSYKSIYTMLNLHFVATGKIDREIAKTLSQLYESRQSGDYDDFVYFNNEDYADLKPRAEKFIATIEKMIG